MSKRSSRRLRNGLEMIASWLVGLTCVPTASAQLAPSGFFTDPVLVLRVGGHQAPVRAMTFTPGGTQLITGGMDKVIHVWNLDVDRSGPARTIRPPQWRGSRGQINALAISPRDDGGNQRLLAVAGAGVLGDQGEILLFRYPGLIEQATGEVVGQLPATVEGVIGPGHRGVVTALAFTPDGRHLVSASYDRTVMLWDVDARKRVAVLNESQAEVNSLSLFDGGKKLVTAGNDGVVRLYDLAVKDRPRLLNQFPKEGHKPPFTVNMRINVVAASPDGKMIVAGGEQGRVARYDPELKKAAVIEVNEVAVDLPVLALGFSPDSSKLAISSAIRNLGAETAGIPSTSCVVQIRSLTDPQQPIERLPGQKNLIHALAFSPDSKRLAYSGGDAQAIFVRDFNDPAPAVPDEIKGYGASLWDVGFRVDGQAIRFARVRPPVAGQGPDYEYFHLRGRYFFNPEPTEPAYRHATTAEAGWRIAPIDQFRFNFLNDQGQGWLRGLNPINEQRWWAYTVIPPAPGHPQPVAAVAAQGAIVLWNLATGEKTRSFNGHTGPVYAIASSVDGKWLLTGSADQTVRLWPLDGCDTPPKFGARFERRPDGSWAVAEVTPGGFADGIALKPGHVIERFFIGKDAPAEPANLDQLARIDLESPSWMFSFHARMNGDPAQPLLQVGSTKRDSPALSLFPGVDRRWVLWTPRGFYDSSADGDRKFLGWLTNRGTVNQLLSSTFDSIDKFEARFRQPRAPQPNVIDRLLETANPIQAEAPVLAAFAANQAQPPPPDPVTSRLAALDVGPVAPEPVDRPIVVLQPTLPIRFRALAQAGAAGISRLWVEANGRIVANLTGDNAPPVRQIEGQREIPIGTDRDVRVSLVAIDERGVRREQILDIANQVPLPPAARKSRLEIVALATEDFAARRFPRIAYAEEDARDLARFLGENLIDPVTGIKFTSGQSQARTFLGGKLTRQNLTEAFGTLARSNPSESLGAGDVVVVIVESHYLDFHSKRLIATAEADPGLLDPAGVSASDLADLLGNLTRQGCRVIVLVDAIHEIKNPAWDQNIQEWVRQLQTQARVMTFIAADHGPSSPNGDGHRVFAQAILDVRKAKSARTLRKPGGAMSLFDFERTVTDGVLQQTGRKQHAQLFLPDTISFQVPFLESSAR